MKSENIADYRITYKLKLSNGEKSTTTLYRRLSTDSTKICAIFELMREMQRLSFIGGVYSNASAKLQKIERLSL